MVGALAGVAADQVVTEAGVDELAAGRALESHLGPVAVAGQVVGEPSYHRERRQNAEKTTVQRKAGAASPADIGRGTQCPELRR